MVTAGPIESIEVSGQTISWSVEEAIPECPPETLSGTVYMMNGGSTLPVKVSVHKLQVGYSYLIFHDSPYIIFLSIFLRGRTCHSRTNSALTAS